MCGRVRFFRDKCGTPDVLMIIVRHAVRRIIAQTFNNLVAGRAAMMVCSSESCLMADM